MSALDTIPEGESSVIEASIAYAEHERAQLRERHTNAKGVARLVLGIMLGELGLRIAGWRSVLEQRGQAKPRKTPLRLVGGSNGNAR